MSDKWEYFLDKAYYDKWAVRNLKDRSFQASIHVGTKEEAEFLVLSLNKLVELNTFIESNGWQPIESAPKDGTPVDIYIEALEERYPDAYYCEEEKAFCWDIENLGKRIVFTKTKPTHFKPVTLPSIKSIKDMI